MGLAERADLVARLTLDDKFSGPLKRVNASLGQLGATATKGLQNAATNIARIGVVAAAGIGLAVRSGLESLAELESAVTSVDGAIEQLGFTGQVTGSQVATWANEIERSIGAAFDDKAITQAATTLLRFGKVTPQNLRPALVVMADLATKTGDVDSAATLLARALADPEKAAGKLARSGVILTKVQQDQISALVKTGKVAEAQTFILTELSKATAGAALASQGPYRRALSILADVSEDARKALAEGFLPVIQRVADTLSAALANPRTLGDIRNLGQSLAGAFDRLLTIGTKIPWSSVGDAMRLAGTGAKALLDAFTAMPPWVQTAVLTGWGLNKLTGGALGSIVGQLASGLIKGVLGINAGVVNINAATIGGAGGVASRGVSAVRILGTVALAAGSILAIKELLELRGEQAEANRAGGAALVGQADTFGRSATAQEMQRSLAGIEKYTKELQWGLTPEAIAYQLNIDGVRDRLDDVKAGLRAALAAGAPSSGDPRLRPGALPAPPITDWRAFRDDLRDLGQRFQKTGDASLVRGLVAGFATSTSPSLKSMTAHLATMKELAAKGDPETRRQLSADIQALELLIGTKLDALALATQALATATTANAGWTSQRQGEINVYINAPPAQVKIADVIRSLQVKNNTGPQIAQG